MKEYAVIWCGDASDQKASVEWFDSALEAIRRRAELIEQGFIAWAVVCPDVVPVIEASGAV